MSEKLRLEAEFRDKGVQSGLKKIGGELAVIKQTPGMTQATKWLGEFNEHANGFVKEGGGIKGVMTGIGIGGLTAATSVAELVKSFSELAARTADLREVSRQTGLTVDEVNRLQRAGEKLYIDPSKMSAGLESLSGKMFDFRRHMGELYGELSQFDPDFARKLSLEKPEEQIRDIFNWLSKIKDPQLQRRWTEAFMGDGDLARLLTNGGRDFAQAMKEAADSTASITPDMEAKAKLLHDSILDFQHGWQDFQVNVGPTVFGNLTRAMHEFQGVFEQIKSIYDFLQAAKDHPVQSAGQAVLGAIDRNARENQNQEDRATRAGGPNEKIIFDLPSLLSRGIHGLIDPRPASPDAEAKQEDSNALHKNDVAPLDWIAKQKALEKSNPSTDAPPETNEDGNRSLWSRLFHRSAFMEGGEGGDSAGLGFGGATEMIADGTKQGVLAAFREMIAQNEAEKTGVGHGGLQNASYETYEDDAPGRSNGYGLKGLGAQNDQPPARGLYDAISQAEGTTNEGFNTTLGYGRWGTPDKPLTDMTLNEVQAFGLKMRRAQEAAGKAWNDTSSASGKFQITGSTMMDAAKALGLDPSSTKFDGSTQERMAAWIARTQGLGAWEGFKSHPDQLATARQALRSGDLTGISGEAGSGERAVALGMRLNGASRDQAARALGARLTPGEWCADFVNGALHAAGSRGVNSSIANSFLAWGQEVSKEAAKRGDVLVEDRGRGVGTPGGHVGLFTGERRTRHGREQLEMLSGNYGDHVQAHDWVDSDKLHARRSLNLPEVASKSAPQPAQEMKHTGGADITIHGLPQGTGTRTKTRGLVTAVNLSRGPTMMMPSGTA